MLNTPYTNNSEWIIEDALIELQGKLSKEGFDIEISDFDYEMFSRCESLSINSETLYPDEDLPGKFGVQRGYAGGGMHSGLSKTEIDRMGKNRQAKAERILDLFQATFWSILKTSDKVDESETGETKEDWESLSI